MIKTYKLVNEINDVDVLLFKEDNVSQDVKKRISNMAIEKINKEASASNNKKRTKKLLVPLIAAVICMAAFGAVAYAIEMFGLGKLNYWGNDTYMSTIAESNQYKAMEEYQDYKKSLNNPESKGKEQHVLKEICDKYGLKYEVKLHNAETADEALKAIGKSGFLGEFTINQGQFSYGEYGTVSMIFDNGTATFDVFLYPQDVFYASLPFAIQAENEYERVEWDFVTEDGHPAKGVKYNADITNEELNTIISTTFYEIVVATEGYTIVFCVESDGSMIIENKEQIEEIINLFDYNVFKSK